MDLLLLLLLKSRVPSSSSPATACGNNVGDGVRESDVYSVVVGDRSSLPLLFRRHLPAETVPSFPSLALAPVGGGGVLLVAGSGSRGDRSQGLPSLRGSRDFRLFFWRLVILLRMPAPHTPEIRQTIRKLDKNNFYQIRI